jgi:integrase
MPAKKRNKVVGYKGVYYIMSKDPTGKPERVYYIMYRKDGKLIDEKAGRASKDDMTPAKAASIRSDRMYGKAPSNQEKRRAIVDAEQQAKDIEENRWTVSRLWTAYKENNPALKGIITDENRFRNHLEPVFGDREPQTILPLDVDRLRLKMLKTHKPATVRNTLELLRRIINFGVNKNLCAGLSFKIEFPNVDNETTEDLTPDQLQALLKALDETEYKTAAAMLKLALYSGMRRGELFRLMWTDINFEKGFIAIRNPKGGKGQAIPMNDAARAVLETFPRKKIKTDDKDEILLSEYVFPGKGGGQRVDIIKSAKKIMEAAGIPASFRPFHGLRHVFASTLASSGQVDMYVLQKLLTHKSGAMTQRYAHLRDEALKDASNIMSNVFKPVKAEQKKVVKIDRTGGQ